jgi:ATP-dependent 26S proteasome regulatory subunit
MRDEKENTLLSPAQQRAFEALLAGITAGNVILLKGRPSSGRTTILRKAQSATGGVLVGMRQFMDELSAGQPLAIEEAFLRMVEQALRGCDLVLVDDLHLLTQVTGSCDYPRGFLLDATLMAILGELADIEKKLVFATDGDAPWPILRRAFTCEIGEFQPEDYRDICESLLTATQSQLDYAQIHRFAPSLTAQQLRNACNWLLLEGNLDTESFIEHLRTHHMTSNVEIEEVQRVTWSDLKGVDDLIRELEAKIALPFENDALRKELGLKPKRGVLLAGPPGTGKTTIGRALAHRLKSKFFLIDGTAIAGTHDFYRKVRSIFDAAKRNAPAIVFIDDADVIFEDEDNRGFYRYLLTILDGLESASRERVCVMMTAMHPGNLPAAMLRSGRVELWLETVLPDAEARSAILRERLAQLPAPFDAVDVHQLALVSHGLTGADLRNVVDDAKLLFASDRVRGQPLLAIEAYFSRAVETVRSNRRKYASKRTAKLAEPVKVGFNVD